MAWRTAAMIALSGAVLVGAARGGLRGEPLRIWMENAAAAVPGAVDGMSAVELTAAERREIERLGARRGGPGDGGGATVADLFLIQIEFVDSACPSGSCPEPCNVVLMAWTETAPEPGGVRISVDGSLLGTLPGLPPNQIPGINGVNILNVPAGEHTFAIEATDNGSTDSTTITVLDSQPFGNPQDIQCRSGDIDGGGTCGLIVSFENPGPAPGAYGVFLDDRFVGEIDGEIAELSVAGVMPGEHCVTLLAVEEVSSEVTYRGCMVESCCTITCTSYVPGSCDGSVPPNLTTGIFGLNYLFLNGQTPPCLAACDANSDGSFNVTDATYLFNYLFLNGPAPRGWIGGEPTCVPARSEDDCRTPPAFCASGG
jgi:hypothetical protein